MFNLLMDQQGIATYFYDRIANISGQRDPPSITLLMSRASEQKATTSSAQLVLEKA